jgi:hypothetical protein
VKILTPKIYAEIDAVLSAAVKTKSLVRVYAEAERIRQANLEGNIALEDIAEEIMERAAKGPGFEADPHDAPKCISRSGSMKVANILTS